MPKAIRGGRNDDGRPVGEAGPQSANLMLDMRPTNACYAIRFEQHDCHRSSMAQSLKHVATPESLVARPSHLQITILKERYRSTSTRKKDWRDMQAVTLHFSCMSTKFPENFSNRIF